MPDPAARYTPPNAAATVTPASSRIWRSSVWVSDPSRRVANGARAACAATILAGSAAGPTMA